MRRGWLAVAAVIVSALVLTACTGTISRPGEPQSAASDTAGQGNGTSKSPEFIFTYAENQPEDYPTTLGAYKFAELVKEKTDGRIEILINAGAVLGDEKTVIQQLQFGGIDFTRVSLSPLSEFVPKLNVLQVPYLYKSSEHMWSVLEGEIGDDFLHSFQGSNMVALSWYDAGARSFYNSKRPIEKLEDMKGLTIRVQESGLMMEMVEALGAVPSPMAYAEVYSGLQTGVIDGAENNWPSYETTRDYEVAKYYTVDEHTRVPELQLCAEATWEKLSPGDQEIIRACARESALYERQLWKKREKTAEQKVRAAGSQVVELSPEEKVKFRRAVTPMYEKYVADYMDILNQIIAIGNQY